MERYYPLILPIGQIYGADVTQQLEPKKPAEAAAIDEKPVAKLINTIGSSIDNDFSWFAPLTTQF